MKAAVTLLVLVGLGWGAVYYLGGFGTWDPTEQGREKRAKIHPGMPYTEVFDNITGDPRKDRSTNLKKERSGGQESEMLVPSPEVPFIRERVDGHMKSNGLPHGFTATFKYSERLAFTVYFDGSGNVTKLEDAMTMADLLQMPKG